MQNIEKRYSSGGGAKNHLPAVSTPRGNPEDVEGRTETNKGIGTPHYKEKIEGQKPDVSGHFLDVWVVILAFGVEKGRCGF